MAPLGVLALGAVAVLWVKDLPLVVFFEAVVVTVIATLLASLGPSAPGIVLVCLLLLWALLASAQEILAFGGAKWGPARQQARAARVNSTSLSVGGNSTATLWGAASTAAPVEEFSLSVRTQALTAVLGTGVVGLCAMLLWSALYAGAMLDGGGKDGADLEPSMVRHAARTRASPPPPPPPPLQSGEEGVRWPPRFQASLPSLPFPGHR